MRDFNWEYGLIGAYGLNVHLFVTCWLQFRLEKSSICSVWRVVTLAYSLITVAFAMSRTGARGRECRRGRTEPRRLCRIGTGRGRKRWTAGPPAAIERVQSPHRRPRLLRAGSAKPLATGARSDEDPPALGAPNAVHLADENHRSDHTRAAQCSAVDFARWLVYLRQVGTHSRTIRERVVWPIFVRKSRNCVSCKLFGRLVRMALTTETSINTCA